MRLPRLATTGLAPAHPPVKKLLLGKIEQARACRRYIAAQRRIIYRDCELPLTMYHQYEITADEEVRPLLLAFLADAGFDSFEETDDRLLAFAISSEHERWLNELEQLTQRYPFTYSAAPLEERNWNEVWESGFQPIRIDDRLLIRASFHPTQAGVAQELVIDPKMAFGTGHHATTHMMCELLFDYSSELVAGARVLDYGSGTGVLAILAKRLGAREVDAVDIEPPAAESTADNALENGVELGAIICGELADVPKGPPYDLVLANINRNVILATAGALYERIRMGGVAFFSGILEQDEQLLVNHLSEIGFTHRHTRAREDWRAFVFTRD